MSSHKSPKIQAILEEMEANGESSGPFNRYYLGYFHCFNQQLYYEAHDVLEEYWLPLRGTAQAKYYQGLIQMAGAYVHFKKGRLAPGGRLLMLAVNNYRLYPLFHEGVNLGELTAFCLDRHKVLDEHHCTVNPWRPNEAPQLLLPSISATVNL